MGYGDGADLGVIFVTGHLSSSRLNKEISDAQKASPSLLRLGVTARP